MAKEIELPDGSIAEFPDDMHDDAIRGVLQKKFSDPLKQAMRQQTAEGGIANAFNTGIANASTRLAAGVGSMLPASLAKHFPTQRDVDLLEAGSEGSIPARTGQVAMDIVASAPAALGASKLLPAIAPLRARAAAAITGETAANAGYGALTADEGSAGEGAAWGAGGTLVGNALGRTVGGLVKPTAEAQALMAEGIQPTAGQAMGPNSWLKRGEDMLAKMPIAGASIRSTREKALQDFQAATRRAANPAGPEAAEPMDGLSKAYTKAYGDLVGSAEFAQPFGVANLDSAAQELLQDAGSQVAPSIRNRAYSVVRDTLSGMEDQTPSAFHWAERRLKDIAFQYKSSTSAAEREYGNTIHDAATALHNTWRPRLEGEVQTALEALDQQYAKFVPIRKAGTTGVGTLSSPENYTPRALLQAIRQGDKSASKSGFMDGNRPQQELATVAENVLGSKTLKATEGGLAALLAGGGGATYLGMGVPAVVGTALAYGAGTKPVQKALVGGYGVQPYMEAMARQLRRGAVPALAGGKKDE